MSDPSAILKRRLRAVVKGDQQARGLHFFCQVGGTYHGYGMMTLQLSGAGKILLGWRRSEEERELFSVQLLERDWRRFYQMLVDHPFWECSPSRRKRRDDTEINIHMRVSDQAAGTWSGLQCWGEDLKEFPDLQELMYRISRFTLALSQGDIPSPDWDALLAKEE